MRCRRGDRMGVRMFGDMHAGLTDLGHVVLAWASRWAQHELRVDRDKLWQMLCHVDCGRILSDGLLVPFLPDVGPSEGVPLQVQRLRSGHHAHPERGRYHGPHSRINSHAFRLSSRPTISWPQLRATCWRERLLDRVDVLFGESWLCAEGWDGGSRLPGRRPPPSSRPSPPTRQPPPPPHNAAPHSTRTIVQKITICIIQTHHEDRTG